MDNPWQLTWLIFLVPFVWHFFSRVLPMIRDEIEDDQKDMAIFAEVLDQTTPKTHN